MTSKRCVICNNEFWFDENFYRKRNFFEPKRCDACRGVVGDRKMVLDIPAVLVNIRLPKKIFLNRKDKAGNNFISCIKYRIKRGDDYINIYDQTKAEELNNSVVSLRIMDRGNFQYLVLDRANGDIPEYKLVDLDDSINLDECIWSDYGLGVIRCQK